MTFRTNRPKTGSAFRLAGGLANSLDGLVCADLGLGGSRNSPIGREPGLTWSMTQTAEFDITRMQERGLNLGLNAFAG
jgi:hypothetical protein